MFVEAGALAFDMGSCALGGKTCTFTVEVNLGETIKLPIRSTKDDFAFLP